MNDVPSPASDGWTSLIPGSTPARRAALVVATLLWSFACASPGLFGSWVYDDSRMLENPCYDGWEDLLAVAHRTGPDYLMLREQPGQVHRGSETYRPVTMFGLVATHVIAPRALVHHVVGWSVHILVAGLLLLGIAATLRRGGLDPGYIPWCCATVFLMHPIGVEAYVWINGRSDVMAGAFVMLSAVVALQATAPARHRLLQRPTVLMLSAFLAAALAMGSKETALGALVAVWASPLLWSWQRPSAERDGGVGKWAAVAAAAGVTAYFLAWYFAQEGGFVDAGRDGPPLGDPETRAFAPKLLAIAAGSLLSFEALPMQSYVWLAFRPLKPLEWVGAALMVGLVLHLAWKRDVRGLALLAGGVVTILPTVILIRTLWLGRDRYFYVPLLLLLLAISPWVARAVRRSSERLRWLPGLSFLTLALTASASTSVASSYYANQAVWMTSGVKSEPGDSTRSVFAAMEMADNGAFDGAAAFIAEMPPPPWPMVVHMELINIAYLMGNHELHEQLLADAERVFPDNPQPQVHRMVERVRAGDLDAGLGMVPPLAQTPLCSEIETFLRGASRSPTFDDEQRRRIAQVHGSLPCLPRTRN